MRHPRLLLAALLAAPFPALTAPQPPAEVSESAEMKYECNYDPYYGPALRDSSCEVVLRRGFENVFSPMEYQLTHLPRQGRGFIRCPFKFNDGNCQMVLDYEEKEFPSSLFSPNVLSAGNTLRKHCVRAGSKNGGHFFPVDGNESATLWLGPVGIWEAREAQGLGVRYNGSATNAMGQAAPGGVAVA